MLAVKLSGSWMQRDDSRPAVAVPPGDMGWVGIHALN